MHFRGEKKTPQNLDFIVQSFSRSVILLNFTSKLFTGVQMLKFQLFQ